MTKKRRFRVLRTSSIEYVNINSSIIPVSASITTVDTIPTIDEINVMVNPPEYIYMPSEDKYYQLKGKRPNPENMEYGELAICFKKGYENLMFKNNNNDIIEFNPQTNNNNLNVGGTYTIYNPAIAYNDSYTYTWKIPYTSLMTNKIFIDTCTVSVREVATGKQILADITFNSTDETIDIVLTSTNSNGLLENEYVALCTVLHEKVSTYVSCEMLTKEYARFHEDMAKKFIEENYYNSYINDFIKDYKEYIRQINIWSTNKDIKKFIPDSPRHEEGYNGGKRHRCSVDDLPAQSPA